MNPVLNQPGAFIVIEGPDGSGKSTAARLLAERLRDLGVDVVETRNIGGTPLAEKLRSLILDTAYPMDPVQQNMLISVARSSNLNEVVIPAMKRGAVVICDRYVASTLVFQTLNREGNALVTDQDVIRMHELSCHGAAPDIMLHVHAPADVRAQRRAARAEGLDRFDNGDAEYDLAIANKYHNAGRILGHYTVDIDGSQDPETIVTQMLSAVQPLSTDKAWSILAYQASPGSRSKWHPILNDNGGVFWASNPPEAHFRASDISKDQPGLQIRFVQRSLAITALHEGGLTTEQVDRDRKL